MQQLKLLWNELVEDDDVIERKELAIAERNSDWNRQESYYHRVPHDVRLLIWVGRRSSFVVFLKNLFQALCGHEDLLSARLTCRLVGLKDLHVRSRFWPLWTDTLLKQGAWCSFSLNPPPAPSQQPAPLRSVMRFFESVMSSSSTNGVDVVAEEEKDASGFVAAMRNHRENGRRVTVPKSVPQNRENVWMMKRNETGVVAGVMKKLLSDDSFFVPIFGNALETTARKLVYRLMWGTGSDQQPLFPVKGVFPVSTKEAFFCCFFDVLFEKRVKVGSAAESALRSERISER